MAGNNSLFKITFVVFISFFCLVKPGLVLPRELYDVFFESGSFTLDDKAIKNLDNNIRLLNENPESKVLLEGYCDEKGDPELNRDLSAKRVRAVKQYLVSHGVQIARISTSEIGSTDKFSQDGSLGENRRVHFELVMPEIRSKEGSAPNQEVKISDENSGNQNVDGEKEKNEIATENKKDSGSSLAENIDFRIRKSLAAPLNFIVPAKILNQQYFTVELEVPDDYADFVGTELTSMLAGNGLSDILLAVTKDTKFALEGQNFEINRSAIKKISSGKKSNYESLSWRVKPTEGIQSLILNIEIGRSAGNDAQTVEIPLYERVVNVEPGYISSISLVVSNYRIFFIILSIILILFIMYRNIPGIFPK